MGISSTGVADLSGNANPIAVPHTRNYTRKTFAGTTGVSDSIFIRGVASVEVRSLPAAKTVTLYRSIDNVNFVPATIADGSIAAFTEDKSMMIDEDLNKGAWYRFGTSDANGCICTIGDYPI